MTEMAPGWTDTWSRARTVFVEQGPLELPALAARRGRGGGGGRGRAAGPARV